MKTPAKKPISLLMRQAQKKGGGGRVTLTLGEAGGFFAHLYPSKDQAVTLMREEMTENGRSIALHDIPVAIDRISNKALAYGADPRSPEAALAALIVKVEARDKVEAKP